MLFHKGCISVHIKTNIKVCYGPYKNKMDEDLSERKRCTENISTLFCRGEKVATEM